MKEIPQTPKEQAISKFVSDHMQPEYEGNTIIIREGQAQKQLDPIKPNKVDLSGCITAPAAFYNKRKHLHNPDACHVIYNRNDGTIKLITDERFANDNHVVKGTVLLNPDLLEFHINKAGMKFSVKELMETLKFRRVFFKDRDQNAKIVTSLQGFRAKVEKAIAEVSDNRGFDEKSRITKLEHDLEEQFTLNMPVFKGYGNEEFRVDICVEATSGEVKVWLESRELKDIQQRAMNVIMDEQLKNFENIVCIEQ